MAGARRNCFGKYGAAEPFAIPRRERLGFYLWLKKSGARQMPTRFVRRADQPARKMRRAIGRPVEMGAVASGFAMEEPAGGVVPRHQPAVEENMAMPGRRRAVFVGGATQRGRGRQSRQIGVDDRAQRLGEKGRANEAVHSG